MKKLELACPSCGDNALKQMLHLAPPGKIKAGWIFPCPNCLEFATVTPELTLRKATRQERVEMLTHPETRALVDLFSAHAKEYRQMRNDYMRRRPR